MRFHDIISALGQVSIGEFVLYQSVLNVYLTNNYWKGFQIVTFDKQLLIELFQFTNLCAPSIGQVSNLLSELKFLFSPGFGEGVF